VNFDIKVAELIGAFGHARRRHAVGDKDGLINSFAAEEDLNQLRRNVDAVADQLGEDLGVREQHPDHARFAMVERTHGIEEMRSAGRSARDRSVGLVGDGIGVAEADAHTLQSCVFD